MNSKCCKFMLNQIAFYKDAIRPCCSFSIEKHKLFSDKFGGSQKEIENYFNIRDAYVKMFLNGEIPPCYKDCTIYEPVDERLKQSSKFDNIIVSNRSKCSCNCIYCECLNPGENEKEYKKYLNTKEIYDIKPVLTYMKNNNLIQNGCTFLICGGDCGEYPKEELAYLLYFSNLYNGEIRFLTSGIYYSEIIAMSLSFPKNVVKISVDAGTKQTYEKIKRVKAFDKVWSNIKKYIKSVNNSNYLNLEQARVEIKYIIIPDVNDNIKEVKAFINKCRQVGCKYVRIDVEHNWLFENKTNTDKHKNIKEIINYFFDTLYNDEEINIDFEGVEKDWLWTFVKPKYYIPQIGR